MSIFSAKYKAHRFINYIFYIIVFVLGFLVGLGLKKLDFKKINLDTFIPVILTIDNVSALSTTGFSDVEANVMSHLPSTFSNFDINEYPYVIILNSNSNPRKLRVYFFKNLDNITFKADSSKFYFSYSGSPDHYYTIFNGSYTSYYETGGYSNSASGSIGTNYFSSNQSPYYTNFNVDEVNTFNNTSSKTTAELNTLINKLDFSPYMIPDLVFDEDLFEDDSNFKKVCVDNHSSFSITRASNPQNLDYMTDYDYIWFPYNIHPDDFTLVNYENADPQDIPVINGQIYQDDNVFKFDHLTFNFYNSQEKIDSVFDSEEQGLNLAYKGYTNKYSYYGWSSLLFNLWFDYRDGNDFNFFPIVTFDINHSTVQLSDSGVPHGGGGRRLDAVDEEVFQTIDPNNTYCFYIKNEYLVTQIKTDEFNDFMGSVPTQNGDFNFSTSENKNSSNPSDLFSIVTSFMSKMSGTVHFINTQIYNFFLAMPLIVRMFILSVLTLFLVKLILNMIVR